MQISHVACICCVPLPDASWPKVTRRMHHHMWVRVEKVAFRALQESTCGNLEALGRHWLAHYLPTSLGVYFRLGVYKYLATLTLPLPQSPSVRSHDKRHTGHGV